MRKVIHPSIQGLWTPAQACLHPTSPQVCPALQVPAGSSPKALEVICPWSNTLDTIQTMSWDEDMDVMVKAQADLPLQAQMSASHACITEAKTRSYAACVSELHRYLAMLSSLQLCLGDISVLVVTSVQLSVSRCITGVDGGQCWEWPGTEFI